MNRSLDELICIRSSIFEIKASTKSNRRREDDSVHPDILKNSN